jgi:hypothetical protein
MGVSANVRSVQALIDFRNGLNRFTNDAQGSLQSAEQELRRVEEWLRQRLAYWQTEVQRRQEALRAAEAALARCEASGYRDDKGYYHAPNCSAYTAAVAQANARLQQAQTELNNVKNWMRQIDQAASTFRSQAQQMSRIITGDLPKANSFLGGKINELQTYLGSMTIGGSHPSAGMHGYPYQLARKAFMISSLADPNVGKHIKGWIQQELNRIGSSGYLHSPPGYDVGHKIPGIDQPWNFQWESSSMNRSKGAKHKW